MNIKQNVSLKPYNTFGIDVLAKQFISINAVSELQTVISKHKKVFIVGGGSNILLTKNIEQLVLHLNIKGISFKENSKNTVLVTAAAGENWHNFVLWCLKHNFGGLENLSLIPGNVGTAPMQNIGAYGVEIKNTFKSLEALEIETNTLQNFNNENCAFGYRDSIFKQALKGKYIITSVTFQLTSNHHKVQTSYGAIQQELENNNIKNPSIQEVSNAVIAIRQSKLPNPKELPNCGSFFKNPVVLNSFFLQLKEKYPKIPSYKVSNTHIKIPAGWLIEQCGFKGKLFGKVGVHKNQALVLVNYNNAPGIDILNLSKHIQETVLKQFGIALETEVNVV